MFYWKTATSFAYTLSMVALFATMTELINATETIAKPGIFTIGPFKENLLNPYINTPTMSDFKLSVKLR